MIDYSYQVDTAALYGEAFVPMLSQQPVSALLAEGSEITVLPKRIL